MNPAESFGAQTMLAGNQPTFPVIPFRLRLSPTVEPSSTVVSLEWVDVQPAIGTKVSDYILQHKKVDEYTDTDLYTGKSKAQDFPLCWDSVTEEGTWDFLMPLETWCHLTWESMGRFHCLVIVIWCPHLCAFL